MAESNMPGRHVPRGIRPKNLRKHIFVTGRLGVEKSVFILDELQRLASRPGLPMFPFNEEQLNGKNENP